MQLTWKELTIDRRPVLGGLMRWMALIFVRILVGLIGTSDAEQPS